jgi:hypothetical protein
MNFKRNNKANSRAWSARYPNLIEMIPAITTLHPVAAWLSR